MALESSDDSWIHHLHWQADVALAASSEVPVAAPPTRCPDFSACICRVVLSASLIGLSPILVVSALRVNALFPLLASLAGCSPALAAVGVSWDGPTPLCIVLA